MNKPINFERGDRVELTELGISQGFVSRQKGTKTGTVDRVRRDGFLKVRRDGYSVFSDTGYWSPDFWRKIPYANLI